MKRVNATRPEPEVGQFYQHKAFESSVNRNDIVIRITETHPDFVIYRVVEGSQVKKARQPGKTYPIRTMSVKNGYTLIPTLATAEAAARLGIEPATLVLMAVRGDVHGYYDDQDWHFPVATIDARIAALNPVARPATPLFPDTLTVGPMLTPDAIQEIAGLVALDLTTGTLAEQIAGAVTKVLSAPAYMESLATMVTKKLGRLGLKVGEESEFERLSKRVVNPKGALYPETDEVMVNGTAKH